MTIEIIKKWWRRKKYHANLVHQNGNILFSSRPQYNKEDLEAMIKNAQRDFQKAEIKYTFQEKEK